jgi:hypothetical protein
MMNTPFFPSFRCRLAALGRRTVQTLRQATLAQLQQHLADFLPPALLSSTEEGPNSRQRDFPLRLTFECFVWQMLNPQTSCREVVRHVQTLCRFAGRSPVNPSDSAYVQARQRLPAQCMEQALAATAQAAELRVPKPTVLQGRTVKVVDGSTTQLADTPENQKQYPQPKMQKPGCGFPVLKFLAAFSLSSGAILQIVVGNLHAHELRLLRGLWSWLKKGDIALGDRAFGEYTTLATLPRRGIDVVARLHQQRKVDFRKGRRLGARDALFIWTKGCNQSTLLTSKEWRALPKEITMRILRFTAQIRGFRGRRVTLVTTLLDPGLYPAHEIIGLYARRWRLELCLRDLKSTMGMEQLRCKSAAMARKELLAYLIAHNLIRCVMAEAIARYQLDWERVSFKGTLDTLRQYSAALAQARNRKTRRQLWEDLLCNLARDLVPLRPHRLEPRALKRRPKPFPLLNRPRRAFRETPHRNKYWKNNPRDYRRLN